MPIAVSNQVHVRDDFGRFIAECDGAATRTVQEALDLGVEIAKDFAPVGAKHDRRSAPIMSSFYTHMLSSTSGVFGNASGHALYQEFGTGPHPIPGSPFLRFYWESAGRMWIPGLMGDQDIVNHPGNPEHPFLRPAYKQVARQLLSIAKRNYPG